MDPRCSFAAVNLIDNLSARHSTFGLSSATAISASHNGDIRTGATENRAGAVAGLNCRSLAVQALKREHSEFRNRTFEMTMAMKETLATVMGNCFLNPQPGGIYCRRNSHVA